MTPGLPLHFHSKLSSPSHASPHRKPYKKTVIKDHNREWAESGPLWGKLIYLYSVSAGLNTHCFSFSLALHTNPPSAATSLVPILTNDDFFAPRCDITFATVSLRGRVGKTARTKICRNNHFVFQLWPSVSSEPNSQTPLSLKGQFREPSRTWPLTPCEWFTGDDDDEWKSVNNESRGHDKRRRTGLVCIPSYLPQNMKTSGKAVYPANKVNQLKLTSL